MLFGGQSAEHEVSIASARAIYRAIDKALYDVTLIRITQNGAWMLHNLPPGGTWSESDAGRQVRLVPGAGRGALITATPPYEAACMFDVAFPVLHGSNGEDGAVQGLLQMYGIAFVGAGVLGSAIGMDKDVMKRLLLQAGLPAAKGLVLHKGAVADDAYDQCTQALGSPLFLKPANTGSSVGISKVTRRESFLAALDRAFAYDNKVVVEEFIDGREIECAVIGGDPPRVSVAGEIVTTHEFYSYQAKYEDESATSLIIPADISAAADARIRELAIRGYRVLCCTGMARMDFFLDKAGALWINEINTIPGFTRQSMFPLLWAHSGLSFPDLIDVLITDALERHRQAVRLRRNR